MPATRNDPIYALYELQRLWRTHRDATETFDATMDRACLVYDQLMRDIENPIVVDRARFDRLRAAAVALKRVNEQPGWDIDELDAIQPGDLDPLP
jgi:predicted acetyltransferase